jgi:hypothetical protein
MTKFADQLYDDLIREHGSALTATRPPAVPRRHLPSRRVLLATGAGGLAAAGTAAALIAGGAAPAYALTTNPDGTVTLAVYRPAGIAQVNAKLRRLGDNVYVVPVAPGCPGLGSLPPPPAPPSGHISMQTGVSRDGSITVNAQGIPEGDILVVGIRATTQGSLTESEGGARLTSAPAPSCVSLPPQPPPPSSGAGSGTVKGPAGGPGVKAGHRHGSGPGLSRSN